MFNIFNSGVVKDHSSAEDIKTAASLYAQRKYEGVVPIEAPIDFDTLNTLTKEYYSPQARVKRMLLHAKVAAEKGSWWCNIPDVGEEEIALLKSYGFRVFRKESQVDYQYSLNWSDKSVTPKDTSLVEI